MKPILCFTGNETKEIHNGSVCVLQEPNKFGPMPIPSNEGIAVLREACQNKGQTYLG
jgi:hypothetical protein